MSIENPDFLKEKYALHNNEEVASAAVRTEIRTGEQVPQDSAARIQNYLERFTGILEREDPERRERGVEAIKRVLHDKFVIKPEEIPEGYFENQRRLAREQGHGDVEIPKEAREQLTEVIITDQETTLDAWTDYLASKDATYPDWLKYYAIRSVLGMGAYDKEKHQFGKRSKGTTKPFPDLNREALAYVLDAIEKNNSETGYDFSTLAEEDRPQFEKLLTGENFAKLYAFAIEKVTPASPEQLTSTAGKWVKYDKGSDHTPLVQSLQGHGTGWCTAGESTAKAQLETGDFYTFYSLDAKGQAIIPRAAIRMQENKIAEVRGVASEQNLDSTIAPVVEAKLNEFPDGKAYKKKTADMKQLTTIEQVMKSEKPLTTDQLRFLYEVDSQIEGFGYQRDPRIAELRATRNPEKDMTIIFDCTPDQIAHNAREVAEDTKVYVGPLFANIFQALPDGIEHIYTSFPEGRIHKETIEIGGKDAKALIKEMREKKINISDHAMDILKSKDFTVLKETEDAILIRLKAGDLGIAKQYLTTDEIYKRIEELGLELCPAEVGPNYRLQYQNQPMREWFWIGIKQIADRDDYPRAFGLGRRRGGLWLSDDWTDPGDRWNPEDEIVFRLRRHT